MKCINDQRLFDFINNELPSEEQKLIELHLENCTNCKEAFEAKKEEISFLHDNLNEIAYPKVQIPEFIFPKQESIKLNKPKKSLLIKLSVAATILFLISFSILFLTHKKQDNIDFQELQNEQAILITDMNESWHNRDLIFTQTNTETGKTEVFLVSKHNN